MPVAVSIASAIGDVVVVALTVLGQRQACTAWTTRRKPSGFNHLNYASLGIPQQDLLPLSREEKGDCMQDDFVRGLDVEADHKLVHGCAGLTRKSERYFILPGARPVLIQALDVLCLRRPSVSDGTERLAMLPSCVGGGSAAWFHREDMGSVLQHVPPPALRSTGHQRNLPYVFRNALCAVPPSCVILL